MSFRNVLEISIIYELDYNINCFSAKSEIDFFVLFVNLVYFKDYILRHQNHSIFHFYYTRLYSNGKSKAILELLRSFELLLYGSSKWLNMLIINIRFLYFRECLQQRVAFIPAFKRLTEILSFISTYRNEPEFNIFQ